MNQLHHLIADKIRSAGGRITFAEYMAEALYHPMLGYYNRPEMTIGEQGDFFTSPMVHPVFGHCVGRQIYQLWLEMGSPSSFTLLEMGAGTGALARDLLQEWDRLQANEPAANSGPVALRYVIVEQSPVLRGRQRETASETGKGRIEWHATLQEVPGYGSLEGVILSNELFDALPYHRLVMDKGRLLERYVTLEEDGSFAEVTAPLSDERLPLLLDEQIREGLEEGDRLVLSPAAGKVIREMADALNKGYVLTIDYGNLSPDVHWQSARSGGIRCYYKQTLNHDPYTRVGEQDITADVDFSYLQREGGQVGLETVRFSTQSDFLENFGFLDKVTDLQRMAFRDLRADFELQKMLTLYLPQGLGDACKVLMQSKGA
ncbi:class I SAM-dependent methyltransferase [Effusibacillus lacus]|uniref:SAM-dependent methyltransferase n=1 Tax=Effusibacillus lacus TaxID=1348429 RepID=A0A292YNB4_9BACL|nr:SAM-dependent methyltransferase [Effusibacillus lacus]TCS71257.1 SAM-dependent MidA family methyltransferase [Effusibacillus lacus]GAX89884.1 SAM-dependent methyltransferase [Effusibacillus lacus]